MPDATRDTERVTPEAVALAIDVAGLGSRMIAAMVDSLIQGALVLVLLLSFAGVGWSFSDNAMTIVIFVALFLVVWGYYPFFETMWVGRTPGKRVQRLRVVTVDGQPVTLGPVLVRNFVRLVDFLPSGYGVGAIAMLLTRRSQRLGDLAAGTMVVRDRAAPAPQDLVLAPNTERENAARRLDVIALSDRDYELVRSFLERRGSLDGQARRELARRISAAILPRVSAAAHDTADDETFLEAVALAVRARSRPS